MRKSAAPPPGVNLPVPDFLPFRGTRYRAGPDLSSVVAPPYDVIDEEAHARLEAADPHNAVRLILPRAKPPQDPYERAAATFKAWESDGVLATDPTPAFYGYEMRYAGADGAPRRTLGVIGALGLPGDEPRDVLPHERTLPKARTDRLALLRATRANFDPIWCLSLTGALTEHLPPLDATIATAVDDSDTWHGLTVVADPARIDAIRRSVRSSSLVLADGHHRFETARAYRAEHPDDPAAAAVLTLVVELDEAMLDVRAIHRLVHDAPDDLRDRLAGSVRVDPAGPNTEAGVRQLVQRAAREDGLGLVDREGLAWLAPLDASVPLAERDLPPELRDVDAARFDVWVRPSLGHARLSYRDDAYTVAAMVEKGAADAAVLLQPVTVAQIRAAALGGLRMPEKTSFFWPKPRTGLVMRDLESGGPG
jgi:uncharacterized protein (DUF1015 family)